MLKSGIELLYEDEYRKMRASKRSLDFTVRDGPQYVISKFIDKYLADLNRLAEQ